VRKNFYKFFIWYAQKQGTVLMTNKEEIFDLIQHHPEGLDDDELLEKTGIQPRQQVQQLCSQLANSRRIRRESVEKSGKRRKIHNFPLPGIDDELDPPRSAEPEALRKSGPTGWERRLGGLVAATGRPEEELLEEALQLLAMKVLRTSDTVNQQTHSKALAKQVEDS
jgi:hypothetical protein